MRLRNVKNANERIINSKYYFDKYLEYKGKYHEYFKNDNPIHLEIGMGKGDFIIANALKYPNINFIGLEKFDSVIVRALEKAEELDINNLIMIRADARFIDEIFSHEIDTIYLNFSDPWPKDRHHIRRLTSDNFLKKYESIFEGDKKIIQKTDNRKLFEYSLKQYVLNDYKIEDISLDLHHDDITDNIETEYEHKFSLKGNPIYKVSVIKKV